MGQEMKKAVNKGTINFSSKLTFPSIDSKKTTAPITPIH
jgi:hypothetical protein